MSAVSTKTICGRCFSGYIENGVCTSCHAKCEENRNASALPRGARLYGGRYVVGDVLGSGGFGITYAARDVQLSERVAIKELFPDRGFSRTQDKLTVRPDPDQEEYFKHISRRFTEEASMLAKLVGQPNIVSVYNTFSENNTVYYVMEFLEGSDLQHVVVKNGRLSYNKIMPIIMPILDALEIVHSKNMVHRDIKPANIFITQDGSPRLIDFGSARTYNRDRSYSRYATEGFAPYEQYITDGELGPWTDIYSLCVTVYYCMTGKKPPSACDRKLGAVPVPLNKLCPGLPDSFVAAIHKGMAMDIDGRYKNASDLKKALLKKSRGTEPDPKSAWKIMFTKGQMKGKSVSLPENCTVILGRGPKCNVKFPGTCSTVSTVHMTVSITRDGKIHIRDESSRNGSALECMKLNSGAWYTIQPGQRVILARTEEFTVVRG